MLEKFRANVLKVTYYSYVFPRLISARYESLPHVSICRACKNDASNLKK